MLKDIESFDKSSVKHQRNDDIWQDLAASIHRPEPVFKDPIPREHLLQENTKLPMEMAGAAMDSLMYIVAQGAMIDAGIDPSRLADSEEQAALDREEAAINRMRTTVEELHPGQLNTVLAIANKMLEGSGVRFATNQFGGVALVDGKSAIWNLGSPTPPAQVYN